MVLSIQCIIELIFIQVSTDYLEIVLFCRIFYMILQYNDNTFILAELYSY